MQKCINGRTEDVIDISNIKEGNYIYTFMYEGTKMVSILSNIKGEELRKELIKNLSIENPMNVNIYNHLLF